MGFQNASNRSLLLLLLLALSLQGVIDVVCSQTITTGATGDRNDIDAVAAAQRACVETPAEFVEAFAAREPRCVSKHLIGRVFTGRDASSIYLQVNSKPATFYSGSDALERYLRSGFPETFGFFTPSSEAARSQPNFPGLENVSNGFGLLQTIGYSPEYIRIDSLYVLSVFDARDIDTLVASQNASAYPFHADIGPVQPTWDAVKEYYEWVYDDLGLVVPDQAIDVLKNVSFLELSGCPASCSYASRLFPSENATTAVFTRDREEYDTCPAPGVDAVQLTPTAPDGKSVLCRGYEGRDWKEKVATMDDVFTAKYCAPEESVEAARILTDALRNTTDAIDQAQWFRAFLIQSCIGTFSSLFSGNGFTYTDDNSLLTPTATEYIASPFNISELPAESKADIYFCINGLNGGRPDAQTGACPLPRLRVDQGADGPLADGSLVNAALPIHPLASILLGCIALYVFVV